MITDQCISHLCQSYFNKRRQCCLEKTIGMVGFTGDIYITSMSCSFSRSLSGTKGSLRCSGLLFLCISVYTSLDLYPQYPHCLTSSKNGTPRFVLSERGDSELCMYTEKLQNSSHKRVSAFISLWYSNAHIYFVSRRADHAITVMTMMI